MLKKRWSKKQAAGPRRVTTASNGVSNNNINGNGAIHPNRKPTGKAYPTYKVALASLDAIVGRKERGSPGPPPGYEVPGEDALPPNCASCVAAHPRPAVPARVAGRGRVHGRITAPLFLAPPAPRAYHAHSPQ